MVKTGDPFVLSLTCVVIAPGWLEFKGLDSRLPKPAMRAIRDRLMAEGFRRSNRHKRQRDGSMVLVSKAAPVALRSSGVGFKEQD